jgi:hypothetical protein
LAAAQQTKRASRAARCDRYPAFATLDKAAPDLRVATL